MNERTPVSAYRLLSSPCDRSIVFVSSRGTPFSTILMVLMGRIVIRKVRKVTRVVRIVSRMVGMVLRIVQIFIG